MKKSVLPLISLVLLWGAVAFVVAGSGWVRHAPPGVIPGLVFVAAVALLLGVSRAQRLRESLAAIPLSALLALNVGRAIGAVFLVYAADGRLPAVFADRAGWGDVATAIGAAALLVSGAATRRPSLVFVWNVFGTVDLFVAVGTAAWLTFTRGPALLELTRLPLGLIPLWGVPMYLAMHGEIFRRLWAHRGSAWTAEAPVSQPAR